MKLNQNFDLFFGILYICAIIQVKELHGKQYLLLLDCRIFCVNSLRGLLFDKEFLKIILYVRLKLKWILLLSIQVEYCFAHIWIP